MRIGYLECFAGISGDMLMGALVDAGAPIELLQRTAASLALGAELRVTRVSRSGIQSTKIDVMVNGQVHEPAAPSGPAQEEIKQGQEPAPAHGHHHDHHHHHDHDHTHHSHESHRHDHGRSLPEIRSLLMRADLTQRALDLSLTAFALLARGRGSHSRHSCGRGSLPRSGWRSTPSSTSPAVPQRRMPWIWTRGIAPR